MKYKKAKLNIYCIVSVYEELISRHSLLLSLNFVITANIDISY